MAKSLQHRLSLGIILSVASVALVGAIMVHRVVAKAQLRQFDAQLAAHLDDFVAEVEYEEDGSIDRGFEEQDLRTFREDEEGADFFQLWDHQFRPVLSSGSLRGGGILEAPSGLDWSEEARYMDLDLPDGTCGRAIYLAHELTVDEEEEEEETWPGYVPGAPENQAYLMVAGRDELGAATLARLPWELATLLLCLGTACLVAISLVLRSALRPVSSLSARAASIQPSDLSARLADDGGIFSELLPLVGSFDDLLARVEAALERERRYGANFAHELRTPVAEARTLLEVQQEIGITSLEEAEENSRMVFRIVNRIERLIEVLEALHERNGDLGLRARKVDVPELLEARLAALPAEERDRVALTRSATGVVETDPDILTALLDNLLQNAVYHSVPGSEVKVVAAGEGSPERVVVTISNAIATPLDATDAQLEEPFWRGDQARTGRSHFGLGLALARSYAEVLGGGLRYGRDPGKFQVIVTLPASLDEAHWSGSPFSEGTTSETSAC